MHADSKYWDTTEISGRPAPDHELLQFGQLGPHLLPVNQPQGHRPPPDNMSTKGSRNMRSSKLMSDMRGKPWLWWKATMMDVQHGNGPQQVQESTHIVRPPSSRWREILTPWYYYLRWYLEMSPRFLRLLKQRSCTQAGLSTTSDRYP